MLEARDVPAALYWNPLLSGGMVNTNVDVASNWTDMYGVRPTAAPVSADDLYFTGYSQPGSSGPSYPSANAEIKSADNNQPVVRTYNSIHLLAGYYGTVDFKVSTYVGILELRGGNIAQNDAFYATAGGGHLAVTVHLDWTGGTLNSGPTAGWVHVVGATGIIDPGDGNTLITGSTLNLKQNGIGLRSTADFVSGTTDYRGGFGLIVDSLCQARVVPPLDAQVSFTASNSTQAGDPTGKKKIEVKTGGEFSVNRRPADVNDARRVQYRSELGILNSGGLVTILGRTDVTLTGDVAGATPFEKWGYRQPTDGLGVGLQLENGCKLSTTKGVSIEAGVLYTLALVDADNKPLANQPDAYIDGPVTISGGGIFLVKNLSAAIPESQGCFGVLFITGDVTWSGGFFSPRLKPGTASADRLHVEGTLSISGTANVGPGSVTGSWAGANMGNSWAVIDSNKRPYGIVSRGEAGNPSGRGGGRIGC